MDAAKYYRIAWAAEAEGIARTTLQSAVERGELPVVVTGCGVSLVTLADVRAWARVERRPGRKPKSLTP